jgi:Fe-S cluster assembly protein SufD
MFGLSLASGQQHLDNRTLQHHAAKHTRSDLLYKAAVKGSARSIYGGTIRVDASAQRSDAYQASRNLILDEKAKAHSIPSLEILANDVRCTHGATVGRLDDEQLFYLESRGIGRKQAERLLVRAFLEDIISRLKDEGLRARIEGAVEAKLVST